MVLRKMNKIISLFLLITGMLILASCTTSNKELTFSEGDWDSNAFHNQVAKNWSFGLAALIFAAIEFDKINKKEAKL